MDNLYRQVTETLGDVLAGVRFQIEPPPPGTAPVFLLLTTRQTKVCFASLNEDYSGSAQRALDQFRGLYVMHADGWSKYDLFLVLIAENGRVIPDGFPSKTETDPFFCRKFVLDLRRGLRKELDRLPFVPLQPVVDVGRPVRAEAILREMGTPKLLATYLAKPHEKSPDGIVEGCLGGQFGNPDQWTGVPPRQADSESTEGVPVRLESLEICNFRAYRKAQTFDLQADLVVLYGPNGLGKTSFFDAVDFVCTGGVARFDAKTVRHKHTRSLIDILKHLDSNAEDCAVRAGIRVGDRQKQVIQRRVSDRTMACLDERDIGRKELLMLLSGLADDDPQKTGVGVLEDLFRATHIFGQEFQSLTSDFREDSSLRSDTVSRMLALRDYVDTVNKLDKVISVLGWRMDELERKSKDIEATLSAGKTELERLEKLSSGAQPPGSISETGLALGQQVAAVVGLQGKPDRGIDGETLRNWRGAIELQLSGLSQRLEKTKKLGRELPKQEALERQRSQLEERIRAVGAQAQKGQADSAERQKKLEEIEARIKARLEEERTWRAKKDNLVWALKVAVERTKLLGERTGVEKELEDSTNLMAELKKRVQALRTTLDEMSSAGAKLNADVLMMTGRQRALAELAEVLLVWVELLGQRVHLAERLVEYSKDRPVREHKLLMLRQDMESAVRLESELDRQFRALQAQDTERQTLLSGVKRYIETNVCPVCGEEHPSREALLQRYALQMGIRPASLLDIASKQTEASKRTFDLKKLVGEQEASLRRLTQTQAQAEAERAEVNGHIEWCERQASALGLSSEPAGLGPAITEARLDLTKKTESSNKEISRLQSEADSARRQVHALTEREEALSSRDRELEARRTSLKERLDSIEDEALSRRISLQQGGASLEADNGAADRMLNEIARQVPSLERERQQLSAELQTIRGQVGTASCEIEATRKSLAAANEQLAEIASLTKELGFSGLPKGSHVESVSNTLEGECARLRKLRDDIASFELAMDAAQASAAAVAVRTQTTKTAVELEDCLRDERELRKWHARFSEIRQHVCTKQNKIVGGYTERYGPLTSNLQKRLRGVPGFGDVQLKATSDQKISVSVERDGSPCLAPSDYFSESQLQILMLSLFLSAALTQNWSSFAPVLLDDPVTHFDDMNTYSLVDLLKGLISETPKGCCRRQFMISTCEERFYRLLRQRFSGASDKAIFYVFESIGREGPSVRPD